MDKRILRERIAELAEALAALPQPKGTSAPMGTYAPSTPPSSARSIEETLDQIRLQLKYLMFDMEATRRENHYLREMLERRWDHGEAPDNT